MNTFSKMRTKTVTEFFEVQNFMLNEEIISNLKDFVAVGKKYSAKKLAGINISAWFLQ